MTDTGDDRAARVMRRRAQMEQNVFARLTAAQAGARGQTRRLLQTDAALSSVEWRMLWDLAEAGPLTVRDMAAIQRIDPSMISRALPALQQKGLVDARRDAVDGRQQLIALSDDGWAAYNRAAEIMRARRMALRAHFSPQEIDTLIGLFDRLDAFFSLDAPDMRRKEPTE